MGGWRLSRNPKQEPLEKQPPLEMDHTLRGLEWEPMLGTGLWGPDLMRIF